MFRDCLIETKRLILRPFTMDDLSGFHRVVSQPQVMRYIPEGVMTLEETRGTLGRLIDAYERNTPDKIVRFSLAVTHKESREIMGWCGLGPLQVNPAEIEIYYGLSAHHWGKGIATEAAKAVLNYGFCTIGLDTIVAVVKPENVASRRVIEKLGMNYKKVVEEAPPGSRFYRGLLYYSLDRRRYLAVAGRQ